jgi:hypothetical protein
MDQLQELCIAIKEELQKSITNNPENSDYIYKKVRGWISPAGKHHLIGRDDHSPWLANHIKLPEGEDFSEAYRKGWIGIGHEGEQYASVHNDVLNNSKHPATIKLRQLMNEHFDPKLPIDIGPNHHDEATQQKIWKAPMPDPHNFMQTGKVTPITTPKLKKNDELVKRKWTTPEARAIRIHEQKVADRKVEHTNTGQRGIKAYTSSPHGTAEEQAYRDFRPPAPIKHFKAGSPEVKAHAEKYKQPVKIAKNGQWSLD